MRRSLVLVALAGCQQQVSITVNDQPPTVVLVQPLDLATFEPGVPFALCAQVNDADDDRSELVATLQASGDGALDVTWTETCDGGNLGATVTLTVDQAQTLSVVVTDPHGKADQAQVRVDPTANLAPSCDFVEPLPDSEWDAGVPIAFQALASDPESPPADLDALLVSTLDGDLSARPLSPAGQFDEVLADLSPGVHVITLSVTDPRGVAGTCSLGLTVNACTDLDADGVDTCAGDCDDDDDTAFPDAEESPDGVDNDCDGTKDEGTVLFDDDLDGFTELEGDCDDDDPFIYDGAADAPYDGVDADCALDSDYDADLDGYDRSPEGPDCDDTDDQVHPGLVDAPYDGVDTNCDGASDYDADHDGHDSAAHDGDDCDDTNPAISPDAPEVPYDGIDQDCSGGADDDLDGDGHADAGHGGDDCDDTDPSVHPGATEIRDGADNDCDLSCDEGLLRAGDLLITEIMYDPDATPDETSEWFELHNNTDVDIRLCAEALFDDRGADEIVLATGAQVHVPARGYAVLGRGQGAPVDYAYGTGAFPLSNSGDEIRVFSGATKITEVAYTSSFPGVTGASMQLKAAAYTLAAQSLSSSWCLPPTSASFGAGDLGTPGQPTVCR